MTIRPPSSDAGRISVMFAIALIGIMWVIGGAVDAGGKLRAQQRADNIAAEAARTGGQGINTVQAFLGGPKVLDKTKAEAAANNYIAKAGASGNALVTDPTHIQTTVTVTYKTVLLNAFNIKELKATGTATATLVVT